MCKAYDTVFDGCKLNAVIVEQNKPTSFEINVSLRPMQKSLLGKHVGDEFKLPNIPLTYKITKIYDKSAPTPPPPPPKSGAEKPKIAPHKRRSIFWVFQGKEYQVELTEGYIWAPYEDASGKEPSHWAMLENVKAGDIIIHGLAQCISAISVAEGGCFDSKIKDGITRGRQINCKPWIIKNTVVTKQYRDAIIASCSRYKYQPFDKNGNGRMGYLFDLNDELAGVFIRALIEKNPTLLSDVPELSDIVEL